MTLGKRHDRKISCCMIGETRLLMLCAEYLLKCGHDIFLIISNDEEIEEWCIVNNVKFSRDLYEITRIAHSFDYLFSIANSIILPTDVISTARRFAINYHDSLLPKYAGINATTWAIINEEKIHGISWHIMDGQVDAGMILKQLSFKLSSTETALTLNLKCFEKAYNGFRLVINDLINGEIERSTQDLSARSFYPSNKFVPNYGFIDWNLPAEKINALIRGLDHGHYANHLTTPKILIDDIPYIIKKHEVLKQSSSVEPGVVTNINDLFIQISTKTRDIRIHEITKIDGGSLIMKDFLDDFILNKRKISIIEKEALNVLDKVNFVSKNMERSSVASFKSRNRLNLPFSQLQEGNVGGFKRVNIPLPLDDLNLLKEDKHSFLLSLTLVYLNKACNVDTIFLPYSDFSIQKAAEKNKGLFLDYVALYVDIKQYNYFKELQEFVKTFLGKVRSGALIPIDIFYRFPCIGQVNQELIDDNSSVRFYVVQSLNSLNEASFIAKFNFVLLEESNEIHFFYKDELINQWSASVVVNHIQALHENYCKCKDGLLSHIGILSESEAEKLIDISNEGEQHYLYDLTIQDVFQHQVRKTPDQVAIVFDGEHLTYSQLDNKSNKAAKLIREQYYQATGKGIQPDTLIAICTNKSIDMVVGILAILKSGAAYVPIDPGFPEKRIQFILEDTQSKILITQKCLENSLQKILKHNVYLDKIKILSLDEKAIANQDGSSLPCYNKGNDLAYAIYTSGTTGAPKGVLIEHHSLINLYTHQKEAFHFKQGQEQVIWLYSYVFDASIEQLFLTLLTGNTLHIFDKEMMMDQCYLSQYIINNKITHIDSTPSYLQQLDIQTFSGLKRIVCGAEICPDKFANALIDKLIFVNAYGVTESTITSIQAIYEKHDNHRFKGIGKPISNMKAYILDENLKPVPKGIIGELYLSGAGLARGYLNRTALTEEKFIANPFTAKQYSSGFWRKMYKTGDLARWLPDGNVDILGRNDSQIKVRGYRIELGEIENALLSYPGIQQCSVIAASDKRGSQILSAYYISSNVIEMKIVVQYLKGILPDYMIPKFLIPLKKIPLTINGKLDVASLPKCNSNEDMESYVPPNNEVEIKLCKIWQEVLNVEKIGINHDFFRKGGDSIRSLNAISRSIDIGIHYSIKDIYVHRTISNISNFLKNNEKYMNVRTCESSMDIHPIKSKILKKINNIYQIQALYPIRNLQEKFISHFVRYPCDDSYRTQILFDYLQEMDPEKLQQAWKLAVQKYPILRSCFNWEEVPIQIISKQANLDWMEYDISNNEDKEGAIRDLQKYDRCKIFDLAKPGLIRISLIKHNYKYFTLILTKHHNVADGWSNSILLRYVHDAYIKLLNNEAVDVAEDRVYLHAQDYCNERRAEMIKYWRHRLRNIRKVNDISCLLNEKLNLKSKTLINCIDEESVIFEESVYMQLKRFGLQAGLTMSVFLQFSWHKLIQIYTGDMQTTVGVNVSGRGIPIEGMEHSVGFYFNTLPLTIDWDDLLTIKDKCEYIQLETGELNQNSHINLNETLRGSKRIFHTLFVFENFPICEDDQMSLKIKFRESIDKLTYPLALVAWEKSGKLHVTLKYANEYLSKSAAIILIKQLQFILKQTLDKWETPHSNIALPIITNTVPVNKSLSIV